MNLATVASPSHARSALNLIGTFFGKMPGGRVVFCHFGGLREGFMSRVREHYDGRVLFREVPKTCAHAYDPGVWFFKAYALVAAMELKEPFLYLDARTAILREPKEIEEALERDTRFYVQLPPSPKLYNGCWTTRKCLRKLGCDEDRYRNFAQYVAGIQAYLPTVENQAHVAEVYKVMHDPEIGGPSRTVRWPDGKEEMCFEHRGDQSILSTLIERNGWQQPFDADRFVKYGDLSTAAHYGKGYMEIPKEPPTVIAFRHLGWESIPLELGGVLA